MSNTFQITRKVRDAVILNLRRIFTGDPKYPYVELGSGEWDYDNGKIFISDIIPQNHAAFPALVVDTVTGPETRYLGPDDLANTKVSGIVVTDTIFASLDLTVNLNLYTIDDTIARDEVMDRIYDHFKEITDDLAVNGIQIKKTTFVAENRSFQDNRWYITARLSMDVYTEWQDDLGAGMAVTDVKINLTLS